MDFATYIMRLWQEIGYVPQDYAGVYEDIDDREVTEQIGGNFTPIKISSSPTKFAGICVKHFSNSADHGKIIEFLIDAGLPPDKKDNIQFGKKGTVTIRDLENSLCLALIDKIHGTKPFSRTLYCNGVIPMTPEKN